MNRQNTIQAKPERPTLGRLYFAATTLAILLALFLAELLVRLTGVMSSYTERNGLPYASPHTWRHDVPWLHVAKSNAVFRDTKLEFDIEIQTNSEGLRDIEHTTAKPDGVYRIIGLGDSSTMGNGAAFEDTYLQVLQRDMDRQRGAVRIEVIAAGHWGSDPVFYYQLLRKRLLKYNPDLVLIALNDTDITDMILRGGMARFGPDGMVRLDSGPWFEWLYARSHVIRLLVHEVFGYQWDLLPPRTYPSREKQALADILDVLLAIKALATQYQFEMLVFHHPLFYHLQKTLPPSALQSFCVTLTASGFRCVDLTPTFRQRIKPNEIWDYYWPRDLHYKPIGYKVLAESLEELLYTVPGFPTEQLHARDTSQEQ